MARNTSADDRSTNLKIKMAKWFAGERAEYEDSEGYTIVWEDEWAVVVADHTGHELNEWADRFDCDREDLRSTFRAMADEVMGEKDAHDAFSHSDPIIFDKLEN